MVEEHFRRVNISRDEITFEHLRSSMVSACIYFESIDVMYIESEPARLFLDFISGVGGIWGLFVGKEDGSIFTNFSKIYF
jgi:hypothetical protein